jgi:hypothetical protein
MIARGRGRTIASLWFAAAFAVAPPSVRAATSNAASQPPSIEQLQAALLMTIARFVEWPPAAFPAAAAPFVVGIVSDEGVAMALEAASRARQVNGRSVVVKRMQWESDVTGVHLLVVGESERRRLGPLLQRLHGKHILTVSTLPEFGSAGGMITLQTRAGHISFAINSTAADRSGLRLSSFLRSHATRVSGDGSNDEGS